VPEDRQPLACQTATETGLLVPAVWPGAFLPVRWPPVGIVAQRLKRGLLEASLKIVVKVRILRSPPDNPSCGENSPIPNPAVCRTKRLVLSRTFKDKIQARSGLLQSTRDLGIIFVHGAVINTLTGVAFEM
jgi:hypothetical protein